jgi:hypothetical protein
MTAIATILATKYRSAAISGTRSGLRRLGNDAAHQAWIVRPAQTVKAPHYTPHLILRTMALGLRHVGDFFSSVHAGRGAV